MVAAAVMDGESSEGGRRRSSRTCVVRAAHKSMYEELPDMDFFSYDGETSTTESENNCARSETTKKRKPEVGGSRLRLRRRKAVNSATVRAEKVRLTMRRVSVILRKPEQERTADENRFVVSNAKAAKEVRRRVRQREMTANRKLEIEESLETQITKCEKLAAAISNARNLVVYTGAGISTAANIPDYRGPNGIWTLLDDGKCLDGLLASCNKDLAFAKPTFTHMALLALYRRGKLKHIASQNCDGLHLRSGIPRYALSELHGNMFVEICARCKPMRPFVRLFDVTEKTGKNRHATGRKCHICGTGLIDTIVHFGERGSLKWPLNWDGAGKAAEKADMILCLGSSLKVLRRYPWLWCMDRPKHQRPALYIVNLQWTPKDSAAILKLNGRCDEIMRRVMDNLQLAVPEYFSENDPLLSCSTSVHPMEEHTTTRCPINCVEDEEQGKTENIQDLGETWMQDHDYCHHTTVKEEEGTETRKEDESMRARKVEGNVMKNGFLPANKRVDFKSIVWPRDALYISYPFGDKLEFMKELERIGETAYFCDCCDSSKKRKRKQFRGSSRPLSMPSDFSTSSTSPDSSSSGEEEEEDIETSSTKASTRNSDDGSETTCSKAKSEDTTSLNSIKAATSISATLAAGWFGKGRRSKRYKN